MSFMSGTYYVRNGFRPAIIKKGHKWAFIMFLDAKSVRCEKVAKKKVRPAMPIVGSVEYSTKQLATRFLEARTLTGQRRFITKKARAMLIEAGGLI